MKDSQKTLIMNALIPYLIAADQQLRREEEKKVTAKSHPFKETRKERRARERAELKQQRKQQKEQNQ